MAWIPPTWVWRGRSTWSYPLPPSVKPGPTTTTPTAWRGMTSTTSIRPPTWATSIPTWTTSILATPYLRVSSPCGLQLTLRTQPRTHSPFTACYLVQDLRCTPHCPSQISSTETTVSSIILSTTSPCITILQFTRSIHPQWHHIYDPLHQEQCIKLMKKEQENMDRRVKDFSDCDCEEINEKLLILWL